MQHSPRGRLSKGGISEVVMGDVRPNEGYTFMIYIQLYLQNIVPQKCSSIFLEKNISSVALDHVFLGWIFLRKPFLLEKVFYLGCFSFYEKIFRFMFS